MSRRTELERELEIVQERIDHAPENTPCEMRDQWREELDSITSELNNLYDDDEIDLD